MYVDGNIRNSIEEKETASAMQFLTSYRRYLDEIRTNVIIIVEEIVISLKRHHLLASSSLTHG